MDVVVGNEHDEHDFVNVSSSEGEPAYDAYCNGNGYFDDFDKGGSFGGDDDFDGH